MTGLQNRCGNFNFFDFECDLYLGEVEFLLFVWVHKKELLLSNWE